MKEIKPIQTYYDGHWFRSRLEARWAVVFNALGVPYEYEPEGFDLGDGLYYLPDFRVKCYGCRGDYKSEPFDLYIEVKGRMDKKDAEKIRKFAGPVEKHGIACLDLSGEYKPCKYRVRGEIGVYCRKVNADCDKSFPYKWNAPGKYPLLIVNTIPNEGRATYIDLWEYAMDGTEIYPFNYETIDGDNFGAYPAATNDGKFYLFGADSSYINRDDEIRMENAYRIARCARFEHGEQPPI